MLPVKENMYYQHSVNFSLFHFSYLLFFTDIELITELIFNTCSTDGMADC